MERYQDYVIKDGKFIGRFEEMYQKFEDSWNQKACIADSYVRHATNVSIRKYHIQSLLEVGCGLGWGSNFWKESNPGLQITGMDISKTAIEKAKNNHPDIHFLVGNISTYQKELAQYDACLFAEIMWYILDDIDVILKNLQYFFHGKTVMVNQTFYKAGVQQYGKEYFTNLDEMCAYLPWKCLEKIVEEDVETGSIDTHSVFRIGD